MARRKRLAFVLVTLLLLVFSLGVSEAFAVGVTTRVSVDSAGTQGDNDSDDHSISADGRYVAFESWSDNLVPGDTGGWPDVFLRDRFLGTTTRLSVSSAGVQGDNWSYRPSISADGRYVAFISRATNLVPGDTNGTTDVFLRDTVMNTTIRVSVSSTGAQASGTSDFPTAISADGRYVAFQSLSTNLVPGDTNNAADIFVRDTVFNTTTRVSVNSLGVQGSGNSTFPSISADGRYVAFHSLAANLVAGDTNTRQDVFVRDTVSNTTTRVSLSSAGTQGDGTSGLPSLSADGRYVEFVSFATNLVPDDTNAASDVFVRDTVSNTTTRVSVDSAGAQGDGNSTCYERSISADGRYVAFESLATNLVPGDTNAASDVFVRDTVSNTTTRVSVNSAGVQGDGNSDSTSISADGRHVAFTSLAANLVSGDTNAWGDVFVRSPLANEILAEAGPGGSVTPAGFTTVLWDGSQTYAITPEAGHHVFDVVVDGLSVGPLISYTFSDVKKPHTISATFAIDTYTIHASAGPGGSIEPAGDTSVPWNASLTCTIAPDPGYHVSDVLVDGVSLGAVTSYEFASVTASHTIESFFDAAPSIDVTKTASPTSVPETGGDVTFTFAVRNTSSEVVTVTSVVDSVFGDLSAVAGCPKALAVGESYAFSVTTRVAGDASGPAHHNVATFTASEKDGNTATASDDATVTFTEDEPPTPVPATSSWSLALLAVLGAALLGRRRSHARTG